MKRLFLVVPSVCLAGLAGFAYLYRYPESVPPVVLGYANQAAEAVGLRPPSSAAPGAQAAAPSAPAGGAPGRGQGRPTAVEVASVKVETVVVPINAVGTMLPNEQVTAAPEIAGRVSRIFLEEGQPVKAGEPLVALDDAVLKAEFASAEAALKLSQANFGRADILARQSTGTLRARDEAVASLESNRAALDLARAKLEKSVILAPFNGVLGLRAVSVGEFVNAGDALVTVQSINPIKVDFRVPETFLGNVRVGQTIDLTLDALPGETFQGEIYAIDPQVDVNGRALRLRATVKNPNMTLKPGLFARVNIAATSRDKAILVPESALVPTGDRRFVFVVRDGRAVRVPVTIGQRLVGEVEVVSGLRQGEVVVTAGQQRLRDGATVEIINATAEVSRS